MTRKKKIEPPLENKIIGTIDITPTWESLVPVMLAVLEDEHGSRESRDNMVNHLIHMARVADAYVNHLKQNPQCKIST